MNHDELSRCLGLIRHYWPHGGTQWTPDVIETWESLLLDLDATDVAAAIQVLSTEGREWPPPPGVIRRKACELMHPLPTGDQAWGELREQIRRIGSTRGMVLFPSGDKIEPEWSHPLVGRVVDRFGWDALCQSTNEMADRAHFLKLWEAACEQERTTGAMPPAARAALAARGVALPDLRIGELPA